jgi:hypothetical protein
MLTSTRRLETKAGLVSRRLNCFTIHHKPVPSKLPSFKTTAKIQNGLMFYFPFAYLPCARSIRKPAPKIHPLQFATSPPCNSTANMCFGLGDSSSTHRRDSTQPPHRPVWLCRHCNTKNTVERDTCGSCKQTPPSAVKSQIIFSRYVDADR